MGRLARMCACTNEHRAQDSSPGERAAPRLAGLFRVVEQAVPDLRELLGRKADEIGEIRRTTGRRQQGGLGIETNVMEV